MLFFSLKGDVKEPVIFKDAQGNPFLRMNVVPTDSEHVNEHGIYCASIFDIRQIGHLLTQKYQDQIHIQVFPDEIIENAFNLPVKLGAHIDKDGKESQFGFEDQFSEFKKSGKDINILFCNAFGNSFNDAYISGNILRKITSRFISSEISVRYEGTLCMAFNQPGMIIPNVHPLSNYFNSIFSLAELLRFDAYWSFSDIEFRSGYESEEYFEFFSRQFGLNERAEGHEFQIDPVSRIQIRNKINAAKEEFESLTLVQTSGSSLITTLPSETGKDFLSKACKDNPTTLFVSSDTYGLELENLKLLTDYSASMQSYLLLLELADKVVSVNSIVPVLCKQLNIPCVFASSTMEPSNLVNKEDTNFVSLSSLEHDYTDPRMIYSAIKEEELNKIWNNVSSDKLFEAYNDLPARVGNNTYPTDSLSGADLIAMAKNPNE